MAIKSGQWEVGDHADWTNPETNTRSRVLVDGVIDARTIRIMLLDPPHTLEWIHPGELAPLDTVSRLAVLDGSKTLKEQLADAEKEEMTDAD